MINEYADVIDHGNRNGRDYWLLGDHITTISIPEGNSKIPYSAVETIAIDILGLHHAEFDYWIGENG